MMNEIDRFHESYIPVPESGCWLWIKAVQRKGYGFFSLGRPKSKRLVQAHRFSYATFVGPIPDGLLVLHKCDVPGCVNPHHLKIGTSKDNAQDALIKGRHTVWNLRNWKPPGSERTSCARGVWDRQ